MADDTITTAPDNLTQSDAATVSAPVTDATVETPVVEAPVDNGAMMRLQQENARLAKLALKLGVDPSSDIASQLEQGLITPDELMSARYNKPPEPPKPAVQSLRDRLSALQTKIVSGQATNSDFAESLNIQQAMYDDFQNREVSRAQVELRDKCGLAVTSIHDADTVTSTLPDDIRAVEEDLILGATDLVLMRETQGDPRYQNPRGYAHFAAKQLAGLRKLTTHFYEMGKKAASQPAQPAQVRPMGSSGGTPNMAPTVRINGRNVDEIARKYVASAQQL